MRQRHYNKISIATLAGAMLALFALPALSEDKPKTDPAVLQALQGPTAKMLHGAPPLDPLAPAFPSQLDESEVPLRLQQASRLFNLIDTAAQGDTWQSEDGCARELGERPGLCNLRWRKSDALSDFRGRYQDASRSMKALVVGEKLADHIEVDIDSSPEIKFKWEFD